MPHKKNAAQHKGESKNLRSIIQQKILRQSTKVPNLLEESVSPTQELESINHGQGQENMKNELESKRPLERIDSQIQLMSNQTSMKQEASSETPMSKNVIRRPPRKSTIKFVSNRELTLSFLGGANKANQKCQSDNNLIALKPRESKAKRRFFINNADPQSPYSIRSFSSKKLLSLQSQELKDKADQWQSVHSLQSLIHSEANSPQIRNKQRLAKIKNFKSLRLITKSITKPLTLSSPDIHRLESEISPFNLSRDISEIGERTGNNISRFNDTIPYSLELSIIKDQNSDDNFSKRVARRVPSAQPYNYSQYCSAKELPRPTQLSNQLPPKSPLTPKPNNISYRQQATENSTYRRTSGLNTSYYQRSFQNRNEEVKESGGGFLLSPLGMNSKITDLNNTHYSLNMNDMTTTSVHTMRDEKGKKVINQYIVLRNLAKGTYGKVKQVVDQNDEMKRMFAMKVIKRAKLKKRRLSVYKTAFDNIEREVAIMKKLQHPHIVRMLEIMDDPGCSKLYLVMELMSGGSLQDLLIQNRAKGLRITESKCRIYFRHLMSGLQYCHQFLNPPIIHRDIKPENLLLDRNREWLKIADFGVSHILEDQEQELSSTVGSSYFLAPEVTLGVRYKGKPSDIWACGVTLYRIVTGAYPFTASSIPDLFRVIQNEEVDYSQISDPGLTDLLKGMLCKDPRARLTMSQIKSHTWVTNDGSDPFPKYKCIDVAVDEEEVSSAISKVTVINKIKLKIRKCMNNYKRAKRSSSEIAGRRGSLSPLNL